MTYTATFFSFKRGLLTQVVEAATELEARRLAAKAFGIRAHIGRIKVKPTEIENDYSGDNSWA